MFKLVRFVGMYEETPRGYSPAWHDYHRRCDVCLPAGLHWLARWCREFWLWTLEPTWREVELSRVCAKSRREGYAAGIEEGKRIASEAETRACAKARREGYAAEFQERRRKVMAELSERLGGPADWWPEETGLDCGVEGASAKDDGKS